MQSILLFLMIVVRTKGSKVKMLLLPSRINKMELMIKVLLKYDLTKSLLICFTM